jgi:DegV family protein with EDD domain
VTTNPEANGIMAPLRIITDATAYLSADMIAQHQITVLPLEIRFGDEKRRFRHGDSLARLFERMVDGPAKPTLATIPGGTFEQAYSQLGRETDDILVILGSGILTRAPANAEKAARPFLGRCRITIMDSMSTSWGLGLVVSTAAKAAERGLALDEIVRLVRGMLPHIYVVFFVERLDYLEQGGRIGAAQAMLGTMLRIRPLLLVEQGEIIPMEKVRTRAMALDKLVDFVGEFASVRNVVVLRSPLEDHTEELIEELTEQLGEILPTHQFPVIEYDPVLACHLGPEALGVLVYEGA